MVGHVEFTVETNSKYTWIGAKMTRETKLLPYYVAQLVAPSLRLITVWW